MLERKLHSGTSKTKELVPVQPDFPLCNLLPRIIPYHVIGSCKGSIISFLDLTLPHPPPLPRHERSSNQITSPLQSWGKKNVSQQYESSDELSAWSQLLLRNHHRDQGKLHFEVAGLRCKK